MYDSHIQIHYSCQHSHLHALQQTLQSAFAAHATLPYLHDLAIGIPTSVDRLAPFIFGAYSPLARGRSYSGELLRTL
jgi:hypothetical protein